VTKWVSFYEIKEDPGPGGYLQFTGYATFNVRDLAAWTMAHGHFLVMGGFHIVEPPDPEANTDTKQDPPTSSLSVNESKGKAIILTLEMLGTLVQDPDFEIQTTEEEITDRSKGDALSKSIFILQSTWFIFQCIARCIQRLDLTHLELTTLALASLNGITFGLWWYKPLGAQAIVRVHLKRKLKDSELLTREVSNVF
jgi:hypothetical protein